MTNKRTDNNRRTDNKRIGKQQKLKGGRCRIPPIARKKRWMGPPQWKVRQLASLWGDGVGGGSTGEGEDEVLEDDAGVAVEEAEGVFA